MVGVAQLVELRIVIPAVAGSIPVAHPNSRHLYGVNRFVVVYSYKNAKVAELVDALDLGSSIVRCESSSLSFRTTFSVVNPSK